MRGYFFQAAIEKHEAMMRGGVARRNELLLETRAADELVHDRLVVEIAQRPCLEQPSVFSDRRSLAAENGFFLEEERFDVEPPLGSFFSRRPRRGRAGNAAPDDDEARSRLYG